MSTRELKVPDLGDFKDVPVIEVLVKPGDSLRAEQPVVVLESEKATMEVPATEAGTVKQLKVKVGDKVKFEADRVDGQTFEGVHFRLEGARIAIQGFGNVGSWASRILPRMGARIVAISDIEGGVYNGDGLDIPQLLHHVEKTRSVKGFADADAITQEELLACDCDILIPAAIGGVINGPVAEKVRAPLVVEAANHPVTPAGDQVLAKRGVTVLPDIIMNAGGVIVSYFEWVQNIQEFRWSLDQVNRELKRFITTAWQDVHTASLQERLDHRLAGYMIGISRVMEATRLRGYV